MNEGLASRRGVEPLFTPQEFIRFIGIDRNPNPTIRRPEPASPKQISYVIEAFKVPANVLRNATKFQASAWISFMLMPEHQAEPATEKQENYLSMLDREPLPVERWGKLSGRG